MFYQSVRLSVEFPHILTLNGNYFLQLHFLKIGSTFRASASQGWPVYLSSKSNMWMKMILSKAVGLYNVDAECLP